MAGDYSVFTFKDPTTGKSFTHTTQESKWVQDAMQYILNNGWHNTQQERDALREYLISIGHTNIRKKPDNYTLSVLQENGVNIDALNTYYETHDKVETVGKKTPTTSNINFGVSGYTDDYNKQSDDILTFDYIDPYTGEMREGTIGDTSTYKYTRMFNGDTTNSSVYYAIEYMLKNGQVDYNNKEERKALESYLESKLGKNIPGTAVKNSAKDAITFFNSNNVPLSSLGDSKYYNENASIKDTTENVKTEGVEEPSTLTEREAAEDYYWRQLYDLEGDTLGADMYNRLTQAEQNAAMSNMQLAEAQYQQAAMDQAAVVKSITDQVKAERMAKLKAGMNEAQIANQDMQLMLNNMNTLNQQVNTLNQNRLAAQQQYNLAQDTAYQQYLNTAAGMAQSAAGFTAAGAGDATRQSLLNMYYTDKYGNLYKKSNQNVTQGYTSNTGGNK